ncbi:unnamed protein product [Porites lobata]|uniref:FYVE-type domain-containing protein n=1 Tax=Porites lobata TaxID=104759 RepID=A0ABN8NEM8_9CNID|nr:unnamed protein product [Porites lobata]
MEGSHGSSSNEGNDTAGLTRRCSDCKKSYKSCDCKNCSKCGTIFQKYWGTNLIKGRSHCRTCSTAVCVTCHVVVKKAVKVCTRCLLKQKEDEMNTQKALSAIEEARTGRANSTSSATCDAFVVVSSLSSLNPEQRKRALFEAAKTGDHYSMVTLLNHENVDINVRDEDKNTPLFFAAEGGHLPCVALLVERNADVTAVNNKSWTPLHTLAWKGSSESHVECGELLIQMGVPVFALTDTLETAADLASRSGGKQELVQLLRAVEVDVAVQNLQERLQTPTGFSTKDPMLKLYVASIVRHINENVPPNSPKWMAKDNPQERHKLLKTPELLRRKDKTKSLDWSLRKHNSCEELRSETPVNRFFGSRSGTPSSNIPTADVEPIIRPDLLPCVVANPLKLEEKLMKCQAEKEDLEQRCKRLMQSIASAAETHDKEVMRLQQEIDIAREQKDIAIKRCEATFVNKMAKIRQETEAAIHEANTRLNQAERDRAEVLHLQNTFRLSWVPDELVNYCSNSKCRAPFTQTRRRHHCRCCGRVFCHNCTDQSAPIPAFGYNQNVRVCNPCFALLDEMFCEEPVACTDPT